MIEESKQRPCYKFNKRLCEIVALYNDDKELINQYCSYANKVSCDGTFYKDGITQRCPWIAPKKI